MLGTKVKAMISGFASEEITTLSQEMTTAGNNAGDTIDVSDKIYDFAVGYVPKIFQFLENVVIAILLLFVGRIVIKTVIKIFDRILTKADVEISVVKFLKSVMRFVLYFVLIVIICSKVGIDTASFIAVLGSAGLAIGLALQGSLANFAGGVIILMMKPFKIGDYIIDKGTGQEGVVSKIDIMYTNLITGDNKSITIPNGSLANSSVTNVSAFDTRRISIQVPIGYTSDIEKAKVIMHKLADADDRVIKNDSGKEPFAFVNTLGDSGVLMELRFWVKSENYWAVTFDMNEKVKAEFDANGIEIPFNQLVVHMKGNE